MNLENNQVVNKIEAGWTKMHKDKTFCIVNNETGILLQLVMEHSKLI